MLLCIEAFFALEPKMILLNQWRLLGILSSRHCHLLEDLVLGVSFYCLALFDEIKDKMNKKTYSP